MTSKHDVLPSEASEGARRSTQAPRQKRSYRRPRLEVIGDIRDVTLSPTPGTFESGMGTGFFA